MDKSSISKNIYLAFLGAGEYKEAVYELSGLKATPTRYVQRAEIEILGRDYFDKVLIALTETAKDKHYQNLLNQLIELGVEPGKIQMISISEELAPDYHWEWFEAILAEIGQRDRLYVDMTHGFRIVPIVISTAIRYLQQIRNISLEAVYYGAYERNKQCSPIINCRDFYVINEWAEGVSRLVNDADADKLVELSSNSQPHAPFACLGHRDFNDSLKELSASIKNVEVMQVPLKANKALKNLTKLKKEVKNDAQKELLDIIEQKYQAIATNPGPDSFSNEYFNAQLELIKLYLEHGLFMQGLTAMRELLVTWLEKLIRQEMEELFKKEWKDKPNKKKKKYRKEARLRFAEKILGALLISKEHWHLHDSCMYIASLIYEKLAKENLLEQLLEILYPLSKLRNGFDHAWTREGTAYKNIKEESQKLLEEIINFLHKTGVTS